MTAQQMLILTLGLLLIGLSVTEYWSPQVKALVG